MRSSKSILEQRLFVESYIRRNPGCTITQISATTGMARSDVLMAVRSLVQWKKVKSTPVKYGVNTYEVVE